MAVVGRELAIRAQMERAAGSDAGVNAIAPTRDDTAILSCIERVILKRRSVAIVLRCAAMDLLTGVGEVDSSSDDADADNHDERPATTVINSLWTPQTFVARKGLVRSTDNETMDPEARDALLLAIAVARSWAEEMIAGRIRSFAEIAQRESKSERYVRRLAALAWLSPRIVVAIADGAAPSSMTLRSLTATLPHGWIEQERAFGFEPRISPGLVEPLHSAISTSVGRISFAAKVTS